MLVLADAPTEAASAPTDPLLAAEQAIADNRLATARVLLEPLAAAPGDDRVRTNQILFLLGLVDLAQHDTRSAIARFHRILVSEPARLRVRLELARAYFAARDYANAERQFRFARAGRLPPVVRAKVDAYLAAIRQRRSVSFGFAIAIAGDSNRNAGPAIDGVTLYGIPFQLPGTARQSAGLGLSLDGNAEYAPRIAPWLRWRGGIAMHRAQYRQTLYDDMTATLYSGPHLTLDQWDITMLASTTRRWYAERVYADTLAASIDTTWYATPRLGIGSTATASHTRYALNPLQSGHARSQAFTLSWVPSPTTVLRASAGLGRQDAGLAAYASHSAQLGFIATRDFPGGLTLGLAPGYARIAFDAPLDAFGTTRIDRQWSAQASLIDRRIDWHGLTPRITVSTTLNASTIDLYRFHRNRVEIALTRAF